MISKLIKLEKYSISFASNLFLIYMFFSFIFSRSFVGIYISEYRIGEIFIGICLFLFLYFTFFQTKNHSGNLDNNFRKINIFLLVSFFLISLLSKSDFFSTYTYKSSTYIWTLSALFLGSSSEKLNLNKAQVAILEIILISIFFTSIYEYPNFIIEFFNSYSDKYEPHKGSDLALFFILINLLINNFFKYNRISLNLFAINLGFFIPLILYRSRGAFLGLIIFIIYQLYVFSNKGILFSKKTFPVAVIFLLIATYSTLVSQVKDFPEEISAELVANSYSSLGEYRLQHYQKDFPILYFENGRIYSGDGNLNWRLSMWQGQIEYMVDEELVIFGSGYKDKLHVFSIDNTGYGNDRTGLDETNENIHNYFVQIFSRGGLVHLFTFSFFYIHLIRWYFKTTYKKDILFFLLPLILVSLFDSSMENAHFPLIFYYFLGNLYFSNNLN